MRTRVAAGLLVVGLMGLMATVLAGPGPRPAVDYDHHAFVPMVSRELPPPPPPQVDVPDVVWMSLASGVVSPNSPIEFRDTFHNGVGLQFEEPTHPALIAWYARYGRPGYGGHNSLFSAHINYVNYGDGPFRYLTSAQVSDFLYLGMDNGDVYAYQVQSVQVIHLSVLDMGAVVWPGLPPNKERVTLISCGGTFVPNPSGIGGQFESRVILVAERYLD